MVQWSGSSRAWPLGKQHKMACLRLALFQARVEAFQRLDRKGLNQDQGTKESVLVIIGRVSLLPCTP